MRLDPGPGIVGPERCKVVGVASEAKSVGNRLATLSRAAHVHNFLARRQCAAIASATNLPEPRDFWPRCGTIPPLGFQAGAKSSYEAT